MPDPISAVFRLFSWMRITNASNIGDTLCIDKHSLWDTDSGLFICS